MNLNKLLHMLTTSVRGSPSAGSPDHPGYFDELMNFYTDNPAWTRLRLAQIERMVQPARDDYILDLGCAHGSLCRFLAEKGARVMGVDRSPEALDRARKLCANLACEFMAADVTNLGVFPAASFGKIVAADLIEHLEAPALESMLKECFRVLKPGGTLSVLTPNAAHLIERLKAHHLILKQFEGHVAVRNPAQIEHALLEAGFVIDLSYTTTSHFLWFNRIEALLRDVPGLGPWFRYRACVRARKPKKEKRTGSWTSRRAS